MLGLLQSWTEFHEVVVGIRSMAVKGPTLGLLSEARYARSANGRFENRAWLPLPSMQ